MGIFSLFGKKKVQEPVEEIPIVDKALIILTDNPKSGMVEYFKELGIEIKGLYKNLNDLRTDLILYSSDIPTRLLIMDSGVDRFTSDGNGDNLLYDILELSSNNEFDITVLTSNKGLIKSIKSTLKKLSKTASDKADYSEYESISLLAEKLNSYHERFVVGGAEDIVLENPLSYKGEPIDVAYQEGIRYNDLDDLSGINDDTSGDGIIGFEVKI